MEKLGLGLDDESNNQQAAATQSLGYSRRLSIQRSIQSLVHTCQCGNANCSLPSCQKMKRVVQHTKGCKRKTNGGRPTCKQLIALCCYHAKHCQEKKCPVPFALNIKHKLRQQQHRLQQAQMLRRRIPSMQRTGIGGQPPQQGLPSPTSAWPTTPTGQQPTTPQPPPQPQPFYSMMVPPQGQPMNMPQQQGMGSGAGQPTPGSMPQPALQNLLRVLRSPSSPMQQQEVLNILHSNPQILAAFIKQRAAKYVGNQNPPDMPQGMPQGMPPGLQQQAAVHGQQVMNPMQAAVQRPIMPQQQGMGPRAGQATPGSMPQAALQNLLRVLRSPSSPMQHQQVLNILHSNPQLLAALIKQRAAKYVGNQNSQGMPQVMPQVMPQGMPPGLPQQTAMQGQQAMNPMQAVVQRPTMPQQPQQQP